MGLRKGRCYKKVIRAYTRRSKFKYKSFIKTTPQNKIVRYEMGNSSKKFDHIINLISKDKIQIRHNALESARLVVNRTLHTKLGNINYFLKIMIYPHHVLRENKMLTGAHADRMQTGMQQSFGTPVGLAAQVKKGQVIFTAYVDEKNIEIAKSALKKAVPRIPAKCSIEISKAS